MSLWEEKVTMFQQHENDILKVTQSLHKNLNFNKSVIFKNRMYVGIDKPGVR